MQVWENYVEGEEVSNDTSASERRQKEELKVLMKNVHGVFLSYFMF